MSKFLTTKMFLFYTLGCCLLFLYSFTQIDLGLALTRFPALFSVQRAFQYIGYFNRPLSAALYSGIVILLFICYFWILSLARKKKLTLTTIWKYLFITTAILTLSYNAFSYDLFNYIFDAKIVTYYHQNPYEHKALDYPHDPMLGFMHWTHRTYPYGPAWLGISLPFSYLGSHIFLLTFFLFKLLMAACFLGSVYSIQKIAEKTGSKNHLVPVVFFAFNPLIIIESLVSAHNDIVMMFFVLASIYLLIRSKYFAAFLLLLLSVATKYATVFLIPALISTFVLLYMKVQTSWKYIWYTAIACMLLAVLAASQKSGNFQPWYLLYVYPFISLVSDESVVAKVFAGVSLGILGSYIPYLYLGNWDSPVPMILTTLYIIIATVSSVVLIGYFLTQRRAGKR